MKKHSVTMVILLILTLSFMGAVSASEDIADFAAAESYQDDAPIELACDVETSLENTESDLSVSADFEEGCDDVSKSDVISYSLESEENVTVFSDDGETSDMDVSEDCAEGQSVDFEGHLMVSESLCENMGSGFVLSCDEFEGIVSVAFEGENLTAAIDSNLDYDDNYKLGYDVTTASGELLDLESADDISATAAAEIAEINDLTIRDVLNEMVDSSNGYVKYGKSDLLTLSSRNTNSEYIAFFIKRGGSLFVALYGRDGNLVYVENASLKTSAGLWRELHDAIGEGDAYVCSLTVSSWANGVSGNVLYPAYESGENIIQALKYNPPKKESGLPLEDAPYDVLGVPGITDDDAFIWSDDDPGKLARISDIMVKESVTQSVRWTGASQTGMSIEMSYESKPKEMFRERTDLNPEASANNGSEYRKLSNPTSANDVLAESEGSAQVLGVAGNEDALSYESAYETDNSKELEITTPQQIRQIGVEAGEKAVAYFKSKGIDIRSSSDDLYLLTSAGHVKINGMDTWIAFDGLEEGLGFKLSEKSLLPLHTSLWKDLVFYFFWIDSTSKDILSYGLKYCPDENELAEVDSSAQLDEYAGYILGLYDEHSHGNEPYCGGYKQRYWDVTVDSDVLPLNLTANHSAVNKTLNSTKPVNKSDNASNVTMGANFDNVTKRPGERQAGSNPHNILYTLGSIVLVCAIFFSGYSKP